MGNDFEQYGLMNNEEGVIRIPFLLKGRLVIPGENGKVEAMAAFRGAADHVTYARAEGIQIIRERVVDRRSMTYTGDFIYQVMPDLNATELIEHDADKLARELYCLSVKEVLDYLNCVISWLCKNAALFERTRELCRLTSEYPDHFVDHWFSSLTTVFNRGDAEEMIDSELAHWGKPGRDFLDGWVVAHSSTLNSPAIRVRAMPTRQLHITAGNVPEVPIVSALRAILTKSAAAIKLPYGATLPGAMLAIAAHEAAPDHPLTRNLSFAYWRGGDERVEAELFQPNSFDRIVVWGSPESVAAVQSKALFTRVVAFNPRYSLSLIGREAFRVDLGEVARNAVADAMIFNQKACTSSLVHYIEGTEEQADEYAEAVLKAMGKWDTTFPNLISPDATGRIKRMNRGRYANARWHFNHRREAVTSCVVVVPGNFDVFDHPMSRMIVVRPVERLEDALKFLSPAVSSVGVFPEARRQELIDRISARGVSSVLPLGQGEVFFAGMPHDGMFVLSELVDWKVG